MKNPAESYQLFIDGNGWMLPTAASFQSFSPAHGETFYLCRGDKKKMLMLRSTLPWKAWKTWKNVPPIERADYLVKIADIIDENKEKLAMIESLDNGEPIHETMAIDVPLCFRPFPLFPVLSVQRKVPPRCWMKIP